MGGSRVGTASGRDEHGLLWQLQAARQLAGGGGRGGSGGVQIGNCTQERLFQHPPTCPQFLGKNPSSYMPLIIALVHAWQLPQAYPLGPGSFSLPTTQQMGVFKALTTRLSPGSLHTYISALPVISVLTNPLSTFHILPGPPPVQGSGLPRPFTCPPFPLTPP